MPLDWKPAQLPAAVLLAGRTVTLEPLNAATHAPSIWKEIAGADELWDWLPVASPADEAALTAEAEKLAAQTTTAFFAIVPKSLGSAAGWASLMRADAPNGVVEVGYILLAPSLQRTTTATEAQYLLARHVFQDLGYRRYEWKCNTRNEPSQAAALRLGFSFEGTFRQHMIVKGENRDTAWFSMLDSEWPARKRAFEQWLSPANFRADGSQIAPLKARASATATA